MDSQSGWTSGNNLRVEELGINRFNVAALSIAWASCQIEQNGTDKLHINKPQHVFGIYILIITQNSKNLNCLLKLKQIFMSMCPSVGLHKCVLSFDNWYIFLSALCIDYLD